MYEKLNLSITGYMGRMGQQIVLKLLKIVQVKIISLTENIIVKKLISGIKPEFNSIKAFSKADVIIDFTTPKCTLEVLKIAYKLKKKVVIGTTGFTRNQETIIKNFLKKIPILKAGNMSLGINLLMYLTEVSIQIIR